MHQDKHKSKVLYLYLYIYRQPRSEIILTFCAEPPVVAKSTIVLDVKPWDTETGSKSTASYDKTIMADSIIM